MRLIALDLCIGIAGLVFLTSLIAIARHRLRQRAEGSHHGTALNEYLWTLIPWLMVIASAWPAVRLIMSLPA
jgi:heme/copper-type cytochrome/quinol oxidase subunit 2